MEFLPNFVIFSLVFLNIVLAIYIGAIKDYLKHHVMNKTIFLYFGKI